jgi:1-deoxy-D-xylulose-5-phosphate reductoisomerase
LEFRPVDEARFPMLRLAREVMMAGGAAPAIYNAANEVAVAAFLAGRLPFLAIPRVVETVLAEMPALPSSDLTAVLAADAEARRRATARLPAANS